MTTQENGRKSRQHRTPEQWKAILEQWQSSGLSAPAFCKAHGLTYSNFCQWRKRLKEVSSVSSDSDCHSEQGHNNAPGFIDISTLSQGSNTSAPWHIVLRLGDGVELILSRS